MIGHDGRAQVEPPRLRVTLRPLYRDVSTPAAPQKADPRRLTHFLQNACFVKSCLAPSPASVLPLHSPHAKAGQAHEQALPPLPCGSLHHCHFGRRHQAGESPRRAASAGRASASSRQCRPPPASRPYPPLLTIVTNSWRVIGLSRKHPSMRLVTMSVPGLRTPRVVMQ